MSLDFHPGWWAVEGASGSLGAGVLGFYSDSFAQQ